MSRRYVSTPDSTQSFGHDSSDRGADGFVPAYAQRRSVAPPPPLPPWGMWFTHNDPPAALPVGDVPDFRHVGTPAPVFPPAPRWAYAEPQAAPAAPRGTVADPNRNLDSETSSSRPKRQSQPGNGLTTSRHDQPDGPTENLFLCYLPNSFDDSRLGQYVSQYGAVRSAKVMVDLKTRQSRGFGFVLMASVDDACRARQFLHGAQVDGKRLQVRFAPPPSSDGPDVVLGGDSRRGKTSAHTAGEGQATSSLLSEAVVGEVHGSAREEADNIVRNLYVKGIPPQWREDQLTALFSSFGSVESGVVLMDGRESKCIGLVQMATRDAVQRALSAAPLHTPGWPQPITVRVSRHAAAKPANSAVPAASERSPSLDTRVTASDGTDPPPHSGSVPEFLPADRQDTCAFEDQSDCGGDNHGRAEVLEETQRFPHSSSRDPLSGSLDQHRAPSPRNDAGLSAPSALGPFGLLLRTNNPYHRITWSTQSSLPEAAAESALPPSGSAPSSAAESSAPTPTPAVVASPGNYGSALTPLPSGTVNFAPTTRSGQSSLPRSSSVTSAVAAEVHGCPYCELGTTIRVFGVPNEHSAFESWVDHNVSGYGPVIAKEVYYNGTALITFVDPGAAHLAVQMLMYTEYAPELFDCTQELYVG